MAMLNVAAAGVFVSAGASNEGPNSTTVQNAYPWVMTVGASTQARQFVGDVTLAGTGAADASWTGASGARQAVGPAPVYLSPAVFAPAGAPVDPSKLLCLGGALDPAEVAGRIVMCLRGVNNRQKSAEVLRAGGVGMVLCNAPNGTSGTVTDVSSSSSSDNSARAYVLIEQARRLREGRRVEGVWERWRQRALLTREHASRITPPLKPHTKKSGTTPSRRCT
jgi:hypothetical protein